MLARSFLIASMALAAISMPGRMSAAETDGMSFERDVVPVLSAYCWKCHGADGRQADLDMRSLPLLLKGGKSGPALKPGAADASLLLEMLLSGKMPPKGQIKPTDKHIETLRRWIDAGAPAAYQGRPLSEAEVPPLLDEDRRWWAFQSPLRPHVPPLSDDHVGRTPIDAFLLEKLQAQGLAFSPPADRVTLVRRVYFDLIGLPPTPDEVDAFARDNSPDAYERLVDRLLASPHYGERWGRHWLDAAGYVDTIGSDNDATIITEREGIWRYRDYVVRSFNDDKPYDRFLLEQIAGDEMVDWRNAKTYTPEIKEHLIATGFLRQASDVTYAPELNTAEIRYQVCYDTVQILTSNVLGLTVKCTQCHSHKFDPVSQADYYRLAAIFAPAYDVQKWKHSKERFLYDVSGREKKQIDAHNADVDRQIAEHKESIAQLRRPFDQKLAAAKLAALPEPIRGDTRSAIRAPAEKRTAVQKYLAEKLGPLLKVSPEEVDKALDEPSKEAAARHDGQIARLTATRRSYGKIQALWDVGPPPTSYLHRRGDYKTPGPAVRPGVIAVLDDPERPLVFDEPDAGSPTSGYRTALARWLVRPDHPLTARVIVNRLWQQYFGRGIVATAEDFGLMGAEPTHPQLLDWLATELVRGGWRLKHLHRLIVTSAAYRQSSREPAETSSSAAASRQIDPENQLLWRMPIRRLESEAIRDQVLCVSGVLDRSQGGPPIPLKPNPDSSVGIDVEKLAQPRDQYRRSIYVFARRNYQLTELNIFDQPIVAHNCTHRISSAVVLQSLMSLNSEFVFDQAEKFALRIRQTSGSEPERRIETAFRLALGRRPSDEEVALSRQLLARQAARHAAKESTTPDEAADAALVNLCHMLLNTNEFLYVQ